jgi:molecular chaperone DnaJ
MSSMNEKDYYEILGVSKDATLEEIRKAFQQKARKLHPDVNKAPDAEERFKEVSEAYAVLSDPEKRQRYDAMRSGGAFGAGWGAPAQPGAGSYGYPGAGPFGWGSPFGGATRKRSRAYNPRVGSDVVIDVQLTDDEACEGCKRGVTYQHFTACESCGGTGSVSHEHSETCPTCHGKGRIAVDVADLLGLGVMYVTCPECEGTGRVVAEPCTACGGSGRVLTADEVVVEVPAGVHDGDTITVKGKGNAGTNGRGAGDFVARVALPSERVSRRSATGWQLVGFTLPFWVAGALTGLLGAMAVVIAIPFVLGLYLLLADGIGKKSPRWWRNSMRYLGDGAANGILLAAFMFAFISCSAGMGRVG